MVELDRQVLRLTGADGKMDAFIRETIVATIASYHGQTAYRTPLVGFAPADDPGFAGLRDVVAPGHLVPQDLLPGARTVVAFFVPFDRELVRLQRQDPYVSRAWAEAYIETNRLIDSVCRTLGDALAVKGVRAAWQQPTHNFDPVALVSCWSHKHVAYLCGLGSFGRHRMLITEAGCAGRLGSLVTDTDLPEAALAPAAEGSRTRPGILPGGAAASATPVSGAAPAGR